jgi:hypothetical protein
MLHYSEQRAGMCPTATGKISPAFPGVRTYGGTWETRTYRMYVRDLDAQPALTLYPIQAVLQARGQWALLPLNYGRSRSAAWPISSPPPTTCWRTHDPWIFRAKAAQPKANPGIIWEGINPLTVQSS